MKYLACIVFFTVFTSAPVPRQATDKSAHANQGVKRKSDDHKAPTAPPIPRPDAITSQPNEHPRASIASENKQDSVKVGEVPPLNVNKDWMDKTYWVLSVVLAAVGGFGVFLARRTLKAIERQSKANEDQLAEIRRSAAQTDKMIQHAARQAENGKIAADAAAKSADAARDSAEALVNSERAWIMADIKWQEGKASLQYITRSGGFEGMGVYVSLVCTNAGKSPAWITEKRARFEVVKSLPQEPDLESIEVIQHEPEPLAVGLTSEYRWCPECAGRHGPHAITVMYGIVRYRDIFGHDRETRFGYYLTVDGVFERIPGFPEYNKHT